MARRALLLILAVVVAVGIGYMVAAHRPGAQQPGSYGGAGQVRIPRPVVRGNDVDLESHSATIPTSGDPVAGALSALLDQHPNADHPRAIPAGTRLLSVRVDDGVARVDLSGEFNKLRDSGDTAESVAQNALRKTLSQFPSVRFMLVQVDGKPFDSEHTDWTEPIPVRNEDATAPSP